MRLYPVLALMTSAFALAACGGGGGGGFGSSVLGVSGGVGSNCPLTGVNNTPDPDCSPDEEEEPVTPPATIVDVDGDGIPDTDTDGNGVPDDTDGSVGSGAGGNTTNITTGNRTIALQAFIYDKPEDGKTSLSVLTSVISPTPAGTESDIVTGTKPTKLKFQIDTNTTKNQQWAVPYEIEEYRSGTRNLRWISLGHTNTGITTPPPLVDAAGNPVIYDFADRRYENIAGEYVNYRETIYWNQLRTHMSAKANGGAKDNYREYRINDRSDEVNRDEILQVWDFGDSFAAQYQNAIGGGEPKQQAWTYGGNATTAMPTGGSATYKGRFVATAKSTDWAKPQGADVDPNALWRVQGNTSLTADFGTAGSITGTLTPETWTSYQSAFSGDYTWKTSANKDAFGNVDQSVETGAEPNYTQIYETHVNIEAKIDLRPGLLPGTTTNSNMFTGTASLDEPYSTSSNPVYGSFFGTNANEVTGVFNADGVRDDPLGGSTGVNDNRSGYLTINGAFNAVCTNAGGACPP